MVFKYSSSKIKSGFFVPWPTKKSHSERLREFQITNRTNIVKSEEWAFPFLESSSLHWSHQALWGARIFDFWIGLKGVAIEIDDISHKKRKWYDHLTDKHFWEKSKIIVIRVKAYDKDGLLKAIKRAEDSSDWKSRRDYYKKINN